MFSGRFEHSLDAKGRVSLPAKFREVLRKNGGESVILTNGFDPCLTAYPVQEWQRFEEKLARFSSADPDVARLKRFYVSGAMECQLDQLGRILVPQTLRQYATIQKNVMWAGATNTIELWALENWQKEMDRTHENIPSIRAALAKLEV